MKIALFHPWLKSKGGAEKLVLEYLKHTKNDVDVYTWGFFPERTFEEFSKFNIHENSRFIKNLADKFFLRSVFPLLKKWDLSKYDLLLISTSGIAELILLKYPKEKLPQKIVFYCHTPLRAAIKEDIEYNNKYRFGLLKKIVYRMAIPIYNRLEKKAWKYPQRVIFNSNLSRERALKKKLINKRKTSIVYPGVDVTFRKSAKDKNYLLYVARYGLAKRQHILLKAWNEIKNKENMKLILVGGSKNEAYFRLLLKLKKKDTAIKVGVSNEELNRLYSESSAGINIPFMEDFGIVPFEVLGAGKTLITVNRGGFTEIIKDAPSVIWIKEKFDERKMVTETKKALEEFIQNKEKYIKLGKKNRKFIEKKDLTWRRFAKQLDEELEKVKL